MPFADKISDPSLRRDVRAKLLPRNPGVATAPHLKFSAGIQWHENLFWRSVRLVWIPWWRKRRSKLPVFLKAAEGSGGQ